LIPKRSGLRNPVGDSLKTIGDKVDESVVSTVDSTISRGPVTHAKCDFGFAVSLLGGGGRAWLGGLPQHRAISCRRVAEGSMDGFFTIKRQP